MTNKEKAKEITDNIYQRYGSGTGYLFGIFPKHRGAVEVIVELTIEILNREKVKKGGEG